MKMFWKVQKKGKTLHYKSSEKWKFLLLKDHWVTSDPKIILRTANAIDMGPKLV